MTMVRFKKLHEAAKVPERQTVGSIGLDLYAFILRENSRPGKIILPPRTTRAIPVGLQIEPPQEENVGPYRPDVCLILSRSGLAKRSIFVANAPGLIDTDYRGEIQVLLYNGGMETYYVQHEDRIAQLVIVSACIPQVTLVTELTRTARGERGFGSTGK